MKVTVIEMFQDKGTKEYHHKGEVLDIADSKRVDELVSCNVVEVAETSKPKKATNAKK